jgi:4-hydroxy-tetrahydrodipicolinate reductase
MGKVLTALIATTEDLRVVAGIDLNGTPESYPVFPDLAACTIDADVIIDFTHPSTLSRLLAEASRRNLAAVIATTGLSGADLTLLDTASQSIPIFRSANMSLGINLMQSLIKSAAKVLGDRYDVEIVEKHHKLKKDAPSGTALMLADSINEARDKKLRYVNGREGRDSLRQADELGIHALRGGTLVGEHDVYFTGTDELIQIGHKAYTRQVFATGAMAAARYLCGRKPGLYSMQDMIHESDAVTDLYTCNDEVLVTLDGFPQDMMAISSMYGEFAAADIFIDMISHSGSPGKTVSISFTVNSRGVDETRRILSSLQARYPGTKTWLEENITKITVEGPGMEYQSGVAYRLFSCMAKAGIHLMAVTTSEEKISCITATGEVEKAVSIIKQEFNM